MNKSLGTHFCPLWCPQALAPELGGGCQSPWECREPVREGELRGGEDFRAPLCRVPVGGDAGLCPPVHTIQGSRELGGP